MSMKIRPNSIIPAPSVLKGLKYVDSIAYFKGYEEILRWTPDGFNTHGWNHYGPRIFHPSIQKQAYSNLSAVWGCSGIVSANIVISRVELDYKMPVRINQFGYFYPCSRYAVERRLYLPHLRDSDRRQSERYLENRRSLRCRSPTCGCIQTGGRMEPLHDFVIGDKITVELNGKIVSNWKAEPRGKIKDFAKEGYIGLQNHDDHSHIYFKIFCKSALIAL